MSKNKLDSKLDNKKIFSMNKKLKVSILAVVIEGILGGCNFIVLYGVLQLVFGEGLSFQRLMMLTSIVAAILIARLVLYAWGYTGSQIGSSEVSRKIRIALGNKIKKIPLGLFSKTHIGFYINVATSDVNSYEQILSHKVADIIKYITLVFVVCIFSCAMFLPVGLTLVVASLLLIPTMFFTLEVVKKYGPKKNTALSENVGNITEYISGIQTLRAYGIGGTKNKAVTKAMKDYSDISYVYECLVLPIAAIYMTISWLSLPLAILFAGNAWLQGDMSSSMLVIQIMLPLFICKITGTLFISLTSYKNLTISKNNIAKIMHESEEISTNKNFSPKDAKIKFEAVDFSYNDNEPVLQNIHFTVLPHSLTALVGDSGSGKSTILNLLSKYYIPQKGRITIGDCTIENVPSEQVLSYISAVDQDVFLFNDTVRNNIRYARPEATNEQIENACSLANCDDFICAMEKGYDSVIGENGNRLSGGERQRLSVARAILKDSPIILLDEATASLDIENELFVKQAIANLLQANKTIIMIAHTLSIIKNADQILVINNGKITETGTHNDLLTKQGKYFAMWNAEQKLSK